VWDILLLVFGEWKCALCGTVWCGFVGSDGVLCLGQFGVRLWGVSLFWVRESSSEFVGSEYVLCVGEDFVTGLGK